MMPSASRAWRCPACGRQVPLRHSTCHCGLARPGPPPAADRRPAAPPRLLRAVAGLLLALTTGIGVLFYYRSPQRWYAPSHPLASRTPPAYPALPEAGPEEPSSSSSEAETDEPPVSVPASDTDPIRDTPRSDATPLPNQAPERGAAASRVAEAAPIREPGAFDAAERRAVTELTPRVTVLDMQAEGVGVGLRGYVLACRPERASALPPADARRDWPVSFLLDPAIASTSVTKDVGSDPTGCARMWSGVRRDADRLAASLDELERFSRSRGLLPGHLRAALAEHRLEGWDRYPPGRP